MTPYASIENASAASMAKEERIQEMAEEVRRKDDQFSAMLARMDVKDKQMNELIMQVATMKSSGRSKQVEDATPQVPRNPKRKPEESGASRGTGSGKNGAWIRSKRTRPDGSTSWTKHARFGFPIADDALFIALEIPWDGSLFVAPFGACAAWAVLRAL